MCEIDIPDGWEFVAHRRTTGGENYLGEDGFILTATTVFPITPQIIVRQKDCTAVLRETITLINTGLTRQPHSGEYVSNNGNFCLCRKPERWGNEHKIWIDIEFLDE